MKRKILYICGSLNQTTMMHQISQELPEYDNYFTPYYADGFINILQKNGLLDFTILGGKFRENTEHYLKEHNLAIDYEGSLNDYDLVFTCSDLIVPKNIRNKRLILVQEGMTDPPSILNNIVKTFKLPRWIAGTSTNGQSDAYDVFCVASEGYRDFFINNGIDSEKIRVTGIPNYDNAIQYCNNDFPYRNFVLVATSDTRETFKYDHRKKFIEEAVKIANDRHIIFKLHPNEKFKRAEREIQKFAPKGTLVLQNGNINEMIANCDVLITQYSTVVYTGIALNKEVYSYFNLDMLKQLSPLQNNGTSKRNIANIARELMSYEKRYNITFKNNIFRQMLENYYVRLARRRLA
mgnify:CR=1 FL=1